MTCNLKIKNRNEIFQKIFLIFSFVFQGYGGIKITCIGGLKYDNIQTA